MSVNAEIHLTEVHKIRAINTKIVQIITLLSAGSSFDLSVVIRDSGVPFFFWCRHLPGWI